MTQDSQKPVTRDWSKNRRIDMFIIIIRNIYNISKMIALHLKLKDVHNNSKF